MSSGRTRFPTGLTAPSPALDSPLPDVPVSGLPLLHLPGRPATGPAGRGEVVTALRSPSSPRDRDDPFAPPPDDAPERPWQPRTPPVHDGTRGPEGQGNPGDHGDPGDQGSGRDGDGGDQGGEGGGSPWSRQQPGRQDSGFGRPGGRSGGPGGSGGAGGGSQGSRFDITDPAQRRARYGLLAGMWGFFFALFGVPQLALLLGALALYWGASSLRGKPVAAARGDGGGGAGAQPVAPVAGQPGPAGRAGPAGYAGRSSQAGTGGPTAKPQFLSAVSGIVAGGIALAMVLGLFATQLVYKDYFDCVSDALTSKARESCDVKLPNWLEPWAKMRD